MPLFNKLSHRWRKMFDCVYLHVKRTPYSNCLSQYLYFHLVCKAKAFFLRFHSKEIKHQLFNSLSLTFNFSMCWESENRGTFIVTDNQSLATFVCSHRPLSSLASLCSLCSLAPFTGSQTHFTHPGWNSWIYDHTVNVFHWNKRVSCPQEKHAQIKGLPGTCHFSLA